MLNNRLSKKAEGAKVQDSQEIAIINDSHINNIVKLFINEEPLFLDFT